MGDVKKVVKTTVEFIVRGDENYYALLDFGKTRATVIDIVKAKVDGLLSVLPKMSTAGGECKVKVIFKTTGQKPKKLVIEATVSQVFDIEEGLIQAQKEMLNEIKRL